MPNNFVYFDIHIFSFVQFLSISNYNLIFLYIRHILISILDNFYSLYSKFIEIFKKENEIDLFN
jgi:hypothetical protein